MTINSNIVSLEDWAPGHREIVLGFLHDSLGEMMFDKNGPIRIIATENCKYENYSQFHGTDEWLDIISRF